MLSAAPRRLGSFARRAAAAAIAHSPRGVDNEPLQRRDLELLRWSAEQYAARTDQLQLLAGCGARTMRRTTARLRARGLIEARALFVGEPAWVTPTSAGLRLSGSPFRVWSIRVGLLQHVGAVNDVRLHIHERASSSLWICERALARERKDRQDHLPDALVITEDGQRVAIEVELTPKSEKRLIAILDELSHRFDALAYFCAPATQRQLGALADSGRWPKLSVRPLPEPRGSGR